MTATLFEREIGYTVKHVLGFGFPNQPVMNTARRLGLYGKVDDFLALAFDAPGAGAPGAFRAAPCNCKTRRMCKPPTPSGLPCGATSAKA